MNQAVSKPLVAIACGGTGGHLFPGIAVAEQLKQRGCDVALLISPKEIDRLAVKAAQGMEISTLPAVGLQNRNYFSFGRSYLKSFLAARRIFRQRPPAAILVMGGFTSAPPFFAARGLGAKAFLHESNTIPGRANRFLSRHADAAFIGFPEAAASLRARRCEVVGTPVRPQFSPPDSRSLTALDCRRALGLEPDRPTVLVVGGSQGARGLNDLILSALPQFQQCAWQWLHLTGAADEDKVRAAYQSHGIKAVIKPFLAEMDLALGAATACVSRAGASSLAELAAMRLPAVLVPLPTAADNHQQFNALAFEKSGAARRLNQLDAAPKKTANALLPLMNDPGIRAAMQTALAQWHNPHAAERIAEFILAGLEKTILTDSPGQFQSRSGNEMNQAKAAA